MPGFLISKVLSCGSSFLPSQSEYLFPLHFKCPRYILSIDNADEIAEYVEDLLQGTGGMKKKMFIDELVERWQRCRRQTDSGPELVLMRETVTGKLDEHV